MKLKRLVGTILIIFGSISLLLSTMVIARSVGCKEGKLLNYMQQGNFTILECGTPARIIATYKEAGHNEIIEKTNTSKKQSHIELYHSTPYDYYKFTYPALPFLFSILGIFFLAWGFVIW